MAQFASSLYPQTNPTNPVLLKLRDLWPSFGGEQKLMIVTIIAAIDVGSWDNFATKSQLQHARRVLTRLASLSG